MTDITPAERKAICDAIVMADHQLDHCKTERDADTLAGLINALSAVTRSNYYLEFTDNELDGWLSLGGDYVRVVLQGDYGYVIANGQLRRILGSLGAQAVAVDHSARHPARRANVVRLPPVSGSEGHCTSLRGQ
jgi:hypothetical protein